MTAANPFALETQLDAAIAGKWGARKRERRRRSLDAELRELVPKLATAEADMRRAFNRWDKLRARCARVERELDQLGAEQ